MSSLSALEHITKALETVKNPSEALKDPSLLPNQGVGKSLTALSEQVNTQMEKVSDQLDPSKLATNLENKNSLASQALGKIKITNPDGTQTNVAEMVAGIFSAWGKLKNMFGFGDDIAKDTEMGEAMDEDYKPSELESAFVSGDEGRTTQAMGRYEQQHNRGARPRGLIWKGPQRSESGTTLCDRSAREFLSGVLGVSLSEIKRSGKDAKSTEALYPSSQKLTGANAVAAHHKSHPEAVFAVFTDSRSPHGHAAAAYFQKMENGTDRLMIYDPYDKSVSGKERGEAFPIESHARISSMRFYPLTANRGEMSAQAQKLVSDGKNIAAPIMASTSTGSAILEMKKSGAFEKLPNFSQKDLEELSKMVQAEAGENNRDGQMRVAAVILNRILSKEFPNTMMGVLQQKRGPNSHLHQFSPMDDGRITKFQPKSDIISAVKEMIASGKDPAKGALFFQAESIGQDNWIGRNRKIILREGASGHNFYA